MTQHRDIYIEMHEGRTTRIVVHRNIEHKHEVTETISIPSRCPISYLTSV